MTRNELNAIKGAISGLKLTRKSAALIATAILEKYDGLSALTKAAIKAVGLDELFEELRELVS